MTIRYLLCPGTVVSRQDGQTHHISAGQLARLYGVPLSQCVILTPNMPRMVNGVDTQTLIRLVPLATGDYRYPSSPRVSPSAHEPEPGSTCGFPSSPGDTSDEPDFRSGGGGDFGGGGATGSWGEDDD